jgi:hypothetical protein
MERPFSVRTLFGFDVIVDVAAIIRVDGPWWAMTKVPHQRLVGGFRGDVDVLMGPVRFSDANAYWGCVQRHRNEHPGFDEGMYQWIAAVEYAAQGGLVWPPRLDYLVALSRPDHPQRTSQNNVALRGRSVG